MENIKKNHSYKLLLFNLYNLLLDKNPDKGLLPRSLSFMLILIIQLSSTADKSDFLLHGNGPVFCGCSFVVLPPVKSVDQRWLAVKVKVGVMVMVTSTCRQQCPVYCGWQP